MKRPAAPSAARPPRGRPPGASRITRRIVAAGLATLVAAPGVGTAQDRDLLGDAARRAAAVEPPPDAGTDKRRTRRRATTLALVGGGLGLVLAGNPRYVPSRFAPGNTPRRVDLGMYLGAGDYPGHSYELVYRRGNAFGTGYGCPNHASHCSIAAQELVDQYTYGFTDGHDAGRYEGLVSGHEQGFAAGQTELIRILDANGLVVYQGAFQPASYVRETFGDPKLLRFTGAGLLAAGALLGLFWPQAQARNLTLTPLPGGGRVAASLGF